MFATLPRCLQLRVTHGNDPADANLERISLWRGTHDRTLISRIWLPADEVDDDFWHESRHRGTYWDPVEALQHERFMLEQRVREAVRAEFFGDDGDVLEEGL